MLDTLPLSYSRSLPQTTRRIGVFPQVSKGRSGDER